MEEFCQGETPWNLDLLWNTTVPRFNRCFQRTVPVWMPSLLLWIAAPIQVFAILGSSKSIPRPIPHNLYNMSRLFTVLGIVGVNFIWFGYDLWFYVRPDVWHARISMADLTCSLLKVFSFILFAFLIYLHRMYGIHTSGLAFTYMFKSLVLSLPSVYMYVMFFGDEDALADEYRIGVRIWDPVELGLFATHFALLLVVFLLTCFADQKTTDLNVGKKRSSSLEHSTKTENGGFDYLKPLMNGHVGTEDSSSEVQELSESPELKVSFLSLITYWWFNGLMSLGYKKSLTLDDLWQLNPDYSTAMVAPQFDRNWLAQKKYSSEVIARYLKTAESNGGIGDTGTLDSQLSSDRFGMDSKEKKKTPGTVRTLVRTFGGQFVVGAFLKLTHDLLSFVNPQLLKYFIGFISSPSDPVWHGYVIAALFFLVSMKQSLMINLYFHKMISIGMKIRTALISAIYRKSLSLSNGALRETTTGEIINLMSVDAQRFEFMIMYINLVWSIPMQISLTMYFLYRELGASVFAGFGVMVLMIPVNVWISKIQQGLQTKQMGQKDERVKFINEVLNGIRVIKLYGWELPFIGKIGAIRHKEIDHLERISYINAFTSIIWTFSPFLVSFVTFGVYIYSSDENVLDAKKAFVSLSLFELLRFPLTILPDMITNLVLTRVAVKRLNRFFNLGQLEKYVKRERSVEWAVEVKNGTFAWEGEVKKDGDGEKTPLKVEVELEAKPSVMKIVTLNGISIKVKKGSLVAIVGRVGSGKSSLLSAILGDLERLDGSVNIDPCESIAYVAQQAWIRNASLRENILFGSKYVKSRYDAVIDMCALKPDLAILPGGDQIEIGEKGINLSGGQKQRVAIARACYSDTSLVLLDDPLSAVDSHVAEHIFRRVMSNDNGYLRNRTRILVTNNISFLPEFDHIIVLSNGTVSESGSYRQLIENSGKFSEFITEHAYEKADDDNNLEDDEDSLGMSTSVRVRTLTASSDRHSINSTTNKLLQHSTSVTSDKFDNQKVEDEDEKLIGTESTATGHVKWSVYMDYFRSLTTLWLVILVVGYVGMQVASVWSNVWLALWSNDYKTNNRTIDGNGTVTVNGIDGRNYRLSIYGVLGTVQGLLFFIGALALVKGTVSSSIKLHSTLLDRIMRSPVQFFDTTPLGRIVNRFSKDIDTVDTTIPTTIDAWLICFLQVVATFVLISFQVPIFMAVAVPILLFYFYLQKYCVATSRQLKRLESVTRSPIYSHFGETLQGVTTIRAFSATARFITQSNERVDTNQRCYFPGFIFNRWLSLRLEFCGNLIVLFAALFSVIKREDFQNEPGFIGLIITYSLSVTGVLNWCVRMTSAMESNIVSVERIQEYCHNKTEQAWNREVNEDPKVEENWPQKGVIEFKNYSVRYREGLDLVLRGIDVKIDAGQKIGIVGRTGAGKSSLTLALFRILEAASGKIVIDGLDIDRIGLHELRSKLSIIPQDPVLFSGTIRSNLDPFDRYSDERLWQALELSHLKEYVAAQESGLDYTVAENGSNLSVGQRQLVCLGRALLRQTSILVLDEATAAIDLSTDAFIQQTIRQQFAGCTVLTIAHRLNTIIDSDRVLVLEQGKVAEFAAPADLLADRRSKFYSLAKDAGLV